MKAQAKFKSNRYTHDDEETRKLFRLLIPSSSEVLRRETPGPPPEHNFSLLVLFHLALRFLKNFIHSPARHRRLHVAQVRIAFLCCGAHVVRFPATVFIAAASRAVLRMREKNKLRSTLNLFSTMLWNASNFW